MAERLTEDTGVRFKRCPLSKPDVANDMDYPLPGHPMLRWIFECKDTLASLNPAWMHQAQRYAEKKNAQTAVFYKRPDARSVGVFLDYPTFALMLRTIAELTHIEDRT